MHHHRPNDNYYFQRFLFFLAAAGLILQWCLSDESSDDQAQGLVLHNAAQFGMSAWLGAQLMGFPLLGPVLLSSLPAVSAVIVLEPSPEDKLIGNIADHIQFPEPTTYNTTEKEHLKSLIINAARQWLSGNNTWARCALSYVSYYDVVISVGDKSFIPEGQQPELYWIGRYSLQANRYDYDDRDYANIVFQWTSVSEVWNPRSPFKPGKGPTVIDIFGPQCPPFIFTRSDYRELCDILSRIDLTSLRFQDLEDYHPPLLTRKISLPPDSRFNFVEAVAYNPQFGFYTSLPLKNLYTRSPTDAAQRRKAFLAMYKNTVGNVDPLHPHASIMSMIGFASTMPAGIRNGVLRELAEFRPRGIWVFPSWDRIPHYILCFIVGRICDYLPSRFFNRLILVTEVIICLHITLFCLNIYFQIYSPVVAIPGSLSFYLGFFLSLSKLLPVFPLRLVGKTTSIKREEKKPEEIKRIGTPRRRSVNPGRMAITRSVFATVPVSVLVPSLPHPQPQFRKTMDSEIDKFLQALNKVAVWEGALGLGASKNDLEKWVTNQLKQQVLALIQQLADEAKSETFPQEWLIQKEPDQWRETHYQLSRWLMKDIEQKNSKQKDPLSAPEGFSAKLKEFESSVKIFQTKARKLIEEAAKSRREKKEKSRKSDLIAGKIRQRNEEKVLLEQERKKLPPKSIPKEKRNRAETVFPGPVSAPPRPSPSRKKSDVQDEQVRSEISGFRPPRRRLSAGTPFSEFFKIAKNEYTLAQMSQKIQNLEESLNRILTVKPSLEERSVKINAICLLLIWINEALTGYLSLCWQKRSPQQQSLFNILGILRLGIAKSAHQLMASNADELKETYTEVEELGVVAGHILRQMQAPSPDLKELKTYENNILKNAFYQQWACRNREESYLTEPSKIKPYFQQTSQHFHNAFIEKKYDQNDSDRVFMWKASGVFAVATFQPLKTRMIEHRVAEQMNVFESVVNDIGKKLSPHARHEWATSVGGFSEMIDNILKSQPSPSNLTY